MFNSMALVRIAQVQSTDALVTAICRIPMLPVDLNAGME